MPEPTPNIVFGAFDRHNFGDLLFPHLVSALLPQAPLVFAGLAARDLRAYGGHQLMPLAQAARKYRDTPVNLIHAGGELLSCTAWQAAAMLLPPQRAPETIAYLDARPDERQAFVRRTLGVDAHAPYTVGRELFPRARAIVYNAVGGVDLPACTQDLRLEVTARMKDAQFTGVRDARTGEYLAANGLASHLLPDSAAMVAELFGAKIAALFSHGECHASRLAFPNGYIALQFSTEFADDAMLDRLAAQLDEYACDSGHGVVLFCAGVAPWHDDPEVYRRLRQRLRVCRSRIFGSLNIWEICALIAASRGYCGSSLHGRIIAMAYALPRINLCLGAGSAAKVAAYAETWDHACMVKVAPVFKLAEELAHSASVSPAALHETAAALVRQYRDGFAAVRALMP